MKFPMATSTPEERTTFNQEEVKAIAEWRNSMRRTQEGRRVLLNMESDENVPHVTGEEYIRNIARQTIHGREPMKAVVEATTENVLLKGPVVPQDYLEISLSRLIKLRDLVRYMKPNIPLYIDEQEIFLKWITDGIFDAKDLLRDDLMRGLFPVVWATFTSEIENHLNQNLEIDDLCERLGLWIDRLEYIIEIRYKTAEARNVRKPTVIEAGPSLTFRPSSTDDPYGFTWDLAANDIGLPEVIHEPIPIQGVDEILARGQKARAINLITEDQPSRD